MTLIVAMKDDDDSVLLAADSGGMEEGGIPITVSDKLKKHETAPIMWACSGNEVVGNDFDAWLANRTCPPTNWDQFKDQAKKYLGSLNKQQRDSVKQSGADPAPNDTASVLIAGWIETLEILELGDRGLVTYYFNHGFHAIGAGKVYAYVAYRTLVKISGPSQLDKLGIIMVEATRIPVECAPPIHIWRATKAGVTDVLLPKSQD